MHGKRTDTIKSFLQDKVADENIYEYRHTHISTQAYARRTYIHTYIYTYIQSPWHYSPDQISDLPLRSIVAEITRESVLLRAHEEVPYVAFVETEKYEERKDGSVKIDQVVR
jgi:GTPase Era involved in 16S rRNA processing